MPTHEELAQFLREFAKLTPPANNPERAQWEDEIGEDLSQALEESGLSITDLIERR